MGSSCGRVRRVRVHDRRALLDACERAWLARRLRRVTWDVGARDAAGALEILREAAPRTERPYATRRGQGGRPVQLYLDCPRSGERALEAAEAIRAEMGW